MEVPSLRARGLSIGDDLYINRDDLVQYMYMLEASLYREDMVNGARTVEAITNTLINTGVHD